ncbi:MAG: hypothetical protein JOS17DRAFT_390065 [Linnemannia elongata]|nr:MAG: hypothetical protein JOS17DRAFT_390065 [Linnemannia elongata]
MLRSEEERERRKQFGGEYRDYEQDDDDDEDEDEEDEGEEEDEEDEDDYEDDIEEEEEGDEEEQEDYDGENESQHYYDDAYSDTEEEEYDPIAEYDYGHENDSNESGQPEDEHMEDRNLSDESDEVSEEIDGSDESESNEEQDETYYDGEEDAEVEDYHGHSSSSSSLSIYDDDASVYRDYHYQEQYQVSKDGYQDHLPQSAPPSPTEPSGQVNNLSSDESITNNMEDDQYLLGEVPGMKLAFGLDYSDDSNHLFGYPINHNIGNSGLHRRASQTASYDAGEGTSMIGYPPPPPPALSIHQPKGDIDPGSSEFNPTFGSMDDYQNLQQHKQQEQQQQAHHQQYQQLEHGKAPQYPPDGVTISQVPDKITFHSHASPEDQAQALTQGGSIATTSTTTTTTTGKTRPRSSFLTLQDPISTYWKRLKLGPSSTPSSSKPASYSP